MSNRQAEIAKALGVIAPFTSDADVDAEIAKRIAFIKNTLTASRTKVLVLGISGGVDSSAAGRLAQLTVEQLRSETGDQAYRFVAIRLPHNVQHDESDAQAALAFIAADEVLTIDIAPAVSGLAKQIGELGELASARRDFVLGNTKARMRMLAQYTVANARNGLGVGFVVLHGLPHDYVLKDGDLLSVDFAAELNGWVTDSALSVVVGTPRPEDLRVIEATEVALKAGIEAAVVGNKLGDISWAIGEVAHQYGYPVNLDFGGHGVGRTMHGEPHIANDGRAGRGLKIKPGLVVALEPWFLHTTDRLVTDPDGWTLRSADGSRGSHSEHTVAITPDGPIVLTDRSFLGVD